MIQRIQSLLLLAAALCFGTACFMPIATLNVAEMSYVYTPWVLKQGIVNGFNIRETYYVGLLLVILAVMSVAAIFFYKNRPLQSKICTATILISFIMMVLMLWIYPDRVFSNLPQLAGAEIQYYNKGQFPWVLLSFVSLACLYFANKFITKDEKKKRNYITISIE